MERTVIFIREEQAHDNGVVASGTCVSSSSSNACPFSRVDRDGSITLQHLMDEYGVSGVVECDANGNFLPRTVFIDKPSDQLHKGSYYITRKKHRDGTAVSGVSGDAAAVADPYGPKAVHFNTRVAVKEYSLPSCNYSRLGGCEESSSRPSIDLLAETPPQTADNTKNETLIHQDENAAHKLCFKAFTFLDPGTGKTVHVTLESFREMMSKTQTLLAEAPANHSRATAAMRDVEQFLQSCGASTVSNPAAE